MAASCVGTVTDVGTYATDPSHYGTFDQGGNVWEWNDKILFTSTRGTRGGDFSDLSGNNLQSSFRSSTNPAAEDSGFGFRVSSLAPIPEPSTYAAMLGLLTLPGVGDACQLLPFPNSRQAVGFQEICPVKVKTPCLYGFPKLSGISIPDLPSGQLYCSRRIFRNMIPEYVKDFYEWPTRWMGEERDIVVGEEIVKAVEPFLLHLIEKGYTKKTIKKHADNLWLMGGEIVRNVSTFDEYDEDIKKMTERSVDDLGGPFCRHLQRQKEIKEFNGTCRKFHQFLNARE